jgi:hypothetical protein
MEWSLTEHNVGVGVLLNGNCDGQSLVCGDAYNTHKIINKHTINQSNMTDQE